MIVKRASYGDVDGKARLQLIVNDDATQVQMDVVGEQAFMFRRVFQMGARIEVTADSDKLTFQRIDEPAEVVNDQPVDLRANLRKA